MQENEPYRPFGIPPSHPARDQLSAGWSLYTVLGEEVGRKPSSRTDRVTHIVFAEFVRCCRLYRCVLSLAVDGFGPEAESLTRGMYDATLVSFWTIANPAEAEERSLLHADYMYHLHQESRIRPGKYPDDDLTPMSPEDRSRAERLFGSYGQLPWTGQKVRQLHKTFVESFENDEVAKLRLETFFSEVYRWLNWSIHGSPFNLLHGTQVSEMERIFRIAPGEVDVVDALRFASDQLIYNIAVTFRFLEQEPSAKLNSRLFDIWRSFNPNALKTGRNDLCPCGSGEKYLHCHLLL